jgi:hypothetical protein
MSNNFKSLKTYKKYIDDNVNKQLSDYTEFMEEAKTVKNRRFKK